MVHRPAKATSFGGADYFKKPPFKARNLRAVTRRILSCTGATAPHLGAMTQQSSPFPLLFLGHGSPMNVISDNVWRQNWQRLGALLPRPHAILCISAHWESEGTWVNGGEPPETIHDFYGFPQALFDVEYRTPADPELAAQITALFPQGVVREDAARGLDHGAWSVLQPMYPDADIPVLQLSLDMGLSGAQHLALGERLRPLREQGVLIIGSGDVVHNLRLYRQTMGTKPDWAVMFQQEVDQMVADRDFAPLADFRALGAAADTAINSSEHYLPLLYTLGATRANDQLLRFNNDVDGSLSMTSYLFAPNIAPYQLLAS